MAAYDSNDMQRMQQDAIRRVQEMHTRAQQSLNRIPEPPRPAEPAPKRTAPPLSRPGHSQAQQPPQKPPPHPEPQQAPPAQISHEPPDGGRETSLAGLFDGLLQDGERTLILVLILLLVSEKADTSLIFALMYLVI